MGGNLFKLGRLPKAEYKVLEGEIKNYLEQKVGDHYRIPRYYGDKADFGDMDIIISSAALKTNWQDFREELIDDLNIETHKSTGNIFSTVYKNFQVDYFVRDHTYFLSTWSFLCFNDIGNLIGRICKRFNLKYGEKGLLYVYRRADEHYSKDISVSTDFKKIFEFLQLDYAQWEAGFEDKTAMFDWLVACPYFSVTPYQSLSTSLQKRLRERPTIQAFIDYLKDRKIRQTYQFEEDRDTYIPMIDSFFPEAKLTKCIAEEQQREAYINVIRTKYNGKLIMGLFPELKNKALGQFMHAFKANFENFEAEMYALSADDIVQRLRDFYLGYQGVKE